jgi:hypothetical protein
VVPRLYVARENPPYRRDRRPGLPIESSLVFYPRFLWECLAKHARLLALVWRFARIRRRLKEDPTAKAYTDLSLTPVTAAELDELELFNVTDAAKAAVDRARRHGARRTKVAPA